MRNLLYYLLNPFILGRFGLAAFVAFVTDHIQRMIAQNGTGTFTERIAATATALSALEDSTLSDDIQYGIRRGVKLAKDNFRAELPEAIRPIYGAVLSAFNDPSPEMRTVFPDGRSAVYDTRDDLLTGKLNFLVDGVTTLQPDLGVEVVNQATALRDQWVTLYAASEEASGGKSATEAERRAARREMADVLYVNLSYIMTLIPHEPERLGLYMQQSLLGGHNTTTPPGGNPPTGGSTSVSSMSTSSMSTSMSSMSASTSSMSTSVSSSSSSMAPSTSVSSSGSSSSA